MKALIATWCMAYEGTEAGYAILDKGGTSADALEKTIRMVEDNPYWDTVGYGGLPNERGVVELDSGFMNGDGFGVGAVLGLRGYGNPISVARALSREPGNNVLAGEGAAAYAKAHGFPEKDLLTERALRKYQRRRAAELHDTVGVVALDGQGTLTAATSTSGLFLKKEGRIGDSPLVGCGFYADSRCGGAAATGVGEDIMKGVICYDVVSRMKRGADPQTACEEAVRELVERLGGGRDISVVALDRQGNCGAATNTKDFSFCYASEKEKPVVRLGSFLNGRCQITPASEQWIREYRDAHYAPVE